MTVSLSLGAIAAALVAFLKYTGRLTWPQLVITFTAGALLAGSAVGLMVQRAAVGGAQMVQTGVTAVSGAADQAGRSTPAASPHPPARPKPAPARKATP